MIKSKNKEQEITCDALIEAMCVIWKLGGAGREDDFEEKELNLGTPSYHGKDKICFHCVFKDHLKYEYPKYKADKGVKCDYEDAQGTDTQENFVGKILLIATKVIVTGYPRSRNRRMKPEVQ